MTHERRQVGSARVRVDRHPQGDPGDAAVGALRRGRDRLTLGRAGREAAGELGIPRGYGTLRGPARRPGRRGRVHPAPQPPPRRVDAARRRGRQARAVREAAGDGRREAAGMIEACRDAGVALMEAFMYRLHPLWLRAHELVDGGAIGELEAIQAFVLLPQRRSGEHPQHRRVRRRRADGHRVLPDQRRPLALRRRAGP